jgi:hypothetical protein
MDDPASATKDSFGDFIVFVDESGDHGLAAIDPEYPVFVLTFCIIEKSAYAAELCPAIARLKFKYFGHDGVVLHEHDIRKQKPPFGLLTNREHRERFLSDLDAIVASAPITVVASVIRKDLHAARYQSPANPYLLAMEFGLERVARFLEEKGQQGRLTHVLFECRGKKEDAEVELEFRRVVDRLGARGLYDGLDIVLLDKKSNSCGLQISDLLARPIGRHVLKPGQPNRAWETISTKLRRSRTGEAKGWGLKVFPDA